MTTSEKNILFLDNALELPYNKKAKILDTFDVDIDMHANFKALEAKMATILTAKELSALQKSANQNLDQIIEGYKRDNIETITIFSDNYPKRLKHLPAHPFCLYCKGNTDLLSSRCIAVVGTRKITDYGKVVTQMFCKEFARAGLTPIPSTEGVTLYFVGILFHFA